MLERVPNVNCLESTDHALIHRLDKEGSVGRVDLQIQSVISIITISNTLRLSVRRLVDKSWFQHEASSVATRN